jgi:hypothetical protein
VELLVRVPLRDDDLAAFLEHVMGQADELSLEELARTVIGAGAAQALARFIRERPAADLVRGEQRDALLSHLQSDLKRFLFSAGLVLERIGSVEFTSATLKDEEALQRATARQVQVLESRNIVERAALAATQRRLDDLGSILTRLKSAAAGEGAQWRELLPSLTPGERGRLLESLWRLTPDRSVTRSVVVVAGHACAWLDPRAPESIHRQVALPDDLGGVRAVDHDPGTGDLLIGAATGVWRVNATDGTVLGMYPVPTPDAPRTGFNAAITSGDRLFATHSQLGAWSWNLSDAKDVTPLLQPIRGVPKTVRAVCTDALGNVLFAAETRVHCVSPSGEALWQSGLADAAIHALAPLEHWLFAGTDSGAVLRADLRVPGSWLVVHRSTTPVESLHARRWDDLIELVIPAGAQGVVGVYAEEGIVARLLTSAMAIRRVWASDDTLVGLTETRDRLIVLGSTMSQRAGVEVPLARLLGQPIQDVCLITDVAQPA